MLASLGRLYGVMPCARDPSTISFLAVVDQRYEPLTTGARLRWTRHPRCGGLPHCQGTTSGGVTGHQWAGSCCGLIRSAGHRLPGAPAGNTYEMDSTDLRCARWEVVNRVSRASTRAMKFFKDAVEDILAGRKTLEPRPRSASWIERLEKVGQASLTYGPRFGASTVFATARITDVTVRPFETVTVGDLARIGYGWADRSCEEFVVEYTRWFAEELEKGYPVAWISFEVIDR
jgi:ASCH domain